MDWKISSAIIIVVVSFACILCQVNILSTHITKVENQMFNQPPDIAICTGEFAFCGGSSTALTGKKIVVNGKVFKEGMSICPVLTGTAIANLGLMDGSCNAKAGSIWSLFPMPPVSSFPQAPTWNVLPAVTRIFTIGDTPETQMSNQWSFPCTKTKVVNGVQLAECLGPIMESPFSGNRVKQGQTAITQAAKGVPYPVGGNLTPQK